MLGNHDLVINLPGSIIRLPLHAGALKAYYDFGLPRPDTVISSSAGAMATSAFAGWDADAFDEGVQIIGNLSPGQIFSFHRELKIKLAALGVASVGLGLIGFSKRPALLLPRQNTFFEIVQEMFSNFGPGFSLGISFLTFHKCLF